LAATCSFRVEEIRAILNDTWRFAKNCTLNDSLINGKSAVSACCSADGAGAVEAMKAQTVDVIVFPNRIRCRTGFSPGRQKRPLIGEDQVRILKSEGTDKVSISHRARDREVDNCAMKDVKASCGAKVTPRENRKVGSSGPLQRKKFAVFNVPAANLNSAAAASA